MSAKQCVISVKNMTLEMNDVVNFRQAQSTKLADKS